MDAFLIINGFFFQAEDGIRDHCVTGVQTCALPISSGPGATNLVTGLATAHMDSSPVLAITGQVPRPMMGRDAFQRSEERRVGKECRSRWGGRHKRNRTE